MFKELFKRKKPEFKTVKKFEIPWKIVHNVEEDTFEIHNEFGY